MSAKRIETYSTQGLEQVFDEMEEEERWKKESQLMIKDSNATATIHTASISDVIGNKAPQGKIIAITRKRDSLANVSKPCRFLLLLGDY